MAKQIEWPPPAANRAAEVIIKGALGDSTDVRCASLTIAQEFKGLIAATENILKQHANRVHESDGEFEQRWEMAWKQLRRAFDKVTA